MFMALASINDLMFWAKGIELISVATCSEKAPAFQHKHCLLMHFEIGVFPIFFLFFGTSTVIRQECVSDEQCIPF